MTNYNELHNAYIDLYVNMRNYIWDFNTVEKLANLEIAVYQTFPDVAEVNKCLNALALDIRTAHLDDENLLSSLDALFDLVESTDSVYAKLDRVQEVN